MLMGPLMPKIGGMRSLVQLWLYNNMLTGAVPQEFGSLKNLETLLIYLNQFTSSLPQNIGDVVNLNYLDLSANEFTGEIPLSFYDLNYLSTAYFSNNTMSGIISDDISNMTEMKRLWLDGKRFSGNFPSVNTQTLKNLEQLLLHTNEFNGTMPSSICELVCEGSLMILTADCTYPPEIICECCTSCQ